MKKSMVEIQALEYNDHFQNRTVIVVSKLNCQSVKCDCHFFKKHGVDAVNPIISSTCLMHARYLNSSARFSISALVQRF
jgi:hypothetical protein